MIQPASEVQAGVRKSLQEIADYLGGNLVGDGAIEITGMSGIREAREGEITFIANSKYAQLLETTQASAVIASADVQDAPVAIIQTDNPDQAFAKLAMLFHPDMQKHPEGVSERAEIGPNVTLGKDVAVQAYAVIEEGAVIGDRSVIYAHAYVGRNVQVGNDCLVYPHVTLREHVAVGHRVIVHAGAVVGSDGFGFATVQGMHHKIPQIGTVVIEDDVEIGANVTIDRARFEKTLIGKGTKIDNLVQIAHNVTTGQNCILVAQAGVSGSTTLGNNVVLAGQAGVVGHISVGDNVLVGAQAGVSKSVPANTPVWGSPAKPLSLAKRVNAALQKLPELVKGFEKLRQRLDALEEKQK